MATFTGFSRVLPDPDYAIGDAGEGKDDGGSKYGPGFASVTLNSKQPILSDTTNAGNTMLTVTKAGSGTLSPGDLINIDDAQDATHTKAYKVVRVETDTLHNTNFGAVANTDWRLTLSPGLQKQVYAGAVIVHTDPLIKVIKSTDNHEYGLNTEGLYSQSLNLKEVY